MSVITEPLIVVEAVDIPLYRQARDLVRLASGFADRARDPAAAALVGDLRVAAQAVAAAVVRALRAASWPEEARWLATVVWALGEVRAYAWDAYAGGALAATGFDALMVATAAMRNGAREATAGARRRVLAAAALH